MTINRKSVILTEFSADSGHSSTSSLSLQRIFQFTWCSTYLHSSWCVLDLELRNFNSKHLLV